jgi:two-component system chemotaxis response regulator CheB
MATAAASPASGVLRVLVVDDLGFMRIALRQIIETDGDMRVVGEARDGEEAVALARELRPDIVTMDLEMPNMDGVEATRRIVGEVSPRPIVIMVSSYTQTGAAATVRALGAGAADFISKETAFAKTDLGHIDSELRNRIRLLADRRSDIAARFSLHSSRKSGGGTGRKPSRAICRPTGAVDLVAIAVSTGGPATLGALLRGIGAITAPVVIAQHMPQFFTACLAESLARDTGLVVREGQDREPVLAGEVIILPGARDAVIAPRALGGFELRLTLSGGTVHPSADLLFESAAMVARHPVAVILTGMGNDGTRGAGRFAQRKLPVLVQRPDSCIVGGMPSAAIDAGFASQSLSIEEIARNLRYWASAGFHPRKAEMAEP